MIFSEGFELLEYFVIILFTYTQQVNLKIDQDQNKKFFETISPNVFHGFSHLQRGLMLRLRESQAASGAEVAVWE